MLDLRYTLGGPASVEERIERDQQRVAAEVASVVPAVHLRALILAGGYGRGEGGYRHTPLGTAPYNDYDYFLVVQGLHGAALDALRQDLHRMAERLGREFDLEVDFAVLPSERLAKLPAGLMYSELKWCNRTLLGDERALDSIVSPPVTELPLAEFSRMMLNRGALLLMNAQATTGGLSEDDGERERFLRYFSKGVLAAADARLAAVGRYHPSVAERGERLRQLDWQGPGREQFLELYEQAVALKLGRCGEELLRRESAEGLQRLAVQAWLDAYQVLEAARLGRPSGSWQAYASPAVPKGQAVDRWWNLPRNVWLAVSQLRERTLRSGWRRVFQHPRERLMAALPLLLSGDVEHADRVTAEALGSVPEASWPDLARLFLADWRRYC